MRYAFLGKICHDIHQGNMSLGQEASNTVHGSVSQGGNHVETVSFMLALLYNPMYTRLINYSHTMLQFDTTL
jgi:hypothetical protein